MEHLIPQVWFDGLATLALLAVGGLALAFLVWGADRLVEAASGMAHRMGIPKVVVGATVVSLGTTSPETAVSVTAAWAGEAGLALGNAVGSIIVDTGLIFGLACTLTRLPADRFLLARQGWVQFGSGLMLAGFCYLAFALDSAQARLERWVGWLFLGLLVLYMVASVHWSRQRIGSLEGPAGVAASGSARPDRTSLTRPLLTMLCGLLLVIVSSRVLVCSATVLASRWGVPQVVLAATLVAMGTSLPELATALASLAKGHPELVVGNIIGADILNVLFVTGASAAAMPLPIIDPASEVPAVFLIVHLPTMLLVLALFRVYIFLASKGGRAAFSRWMGPPLLVFYAAYVVVQLVLAR